MNTLKIIVETNQKKVNIICNRKILVLLSSKLTLEKDIIFDNIKAESVLTFINTFDTSSFIIIRNNCCNYE